MLQSPLVRMLVRLFVSGNINKIDLNQKEFISRILDGSQDHQEPGSENWQK